MLEIFYTQQQITWNEIFSKILWKNIFILQKLLTLQKNLINVEELNKKARFNHPLS
jgi:hypothetical protein